MTAKKKSWSFNPLSPDSDHVDGELAGPANPALTPMSLSAPAAAASVAPTPAASAQRVTPLAPTVGDSISKVYQHWADGDLANPNDDEWNNNILSANKSDYSEGEVIPHVFAFKASNQVPLVPGQTYSFNITYNHYQANTNAGGFVGLDTFNLSRDPNSWPANGAPSADSTFVNSGGTAGLFHTVNADITNVSAVTYTGTGTKDGHVTVTFKYTGPAQTSNGSALIYYGLRIAGPGDVPDQGSGETLGAHVWTGGSLQTTVDIGGSGATSIQLSPAAILVPAMTIDKTVIGVYQADGVTLDSDGIADEAGDIIKYNVKVTNTGEVQLTGVTVQDPLTGQNISGVTLAIGAFADYASQYTVQQSDLDNKGGGDGDIDNTATADSNQTDPVSDSETVPLAYMPGLDVDKTFLGFTGGNGNELGDFAGDELNYRVTVTNTGNVTLTGVTVQDPLTGQNIADVTLAPGASQDFDSKYVLTQADLDTFGGGDGCVDNIATADSNETDQTSDDECVPVVYTPKLEIAKQFVGFSGGNGNTVGDWAGDVLSYKVTITNSGNITLTGVTVKDPLTGQDLSGITLAPGASQTYDSQYTLTQQDLDDYGGGDMDIDNTATADSNETEATSASAEAPLTYTPSMAIDKVFVGVTGGNGNALADFAGDILNYKIYVTNTDSATLTNVTVQDPLTGQDISGVSIGAGETVVFDSSYVLKQSDLDDRGGGDGDIDNTATADSDQTPPTSDSETVPLVYAPQMAIFKDVDHVEGGNGNTTADFAGDVIHYNVAVSNPGNITLTDISVVDPRTGMNVTGLTLIPGETKVYQTTYTLTQGDLDDNGGGDGDIDNTATADSAETDPVSASAFEPVVQRPALALDKLILDVTGGNDNGVADAPGDSLNYRIKVSNPGNMTLTNVTVYDPLTGLNQVLASLAPGASDSWDVSYSLSQADLNNSFWGVGQIDNIAEADSDQTPMVIDEEAVPVLTEPVLFLEKTFQGVTGGNGNLIADTAGEALNYRITITNNGNVTLTDVSVNDPLTGLTQAGLTLEPGDSLFWDTNYLLKQSDLDDNGGGDGYIDNVTTADSAEVLPVTDPESVPLARAVGLFFDEVFTGVSGGNGNDKADAVGDVLNYTFTLVNPGNVTLTNVSVTDSLTGLNLSGFAVEPKTTMVWEKTYTLTQADIDGKGDGDGWLRNVSTADSAETVGVVDGEAVAIIWNPLIVLTKSVSVDNGSTWFDANAPTGPTLLSNAGYGPLYKFSVANTGNVTLTGVEVTDNIYDLNGGDPGTAHSFGDLAVGETLEWVYEGGSWAAGQQTDLAMVTVAGIPGVVDTDNAYYFGVAA